MERELRKRRKQFLASLLALVFVLCTAMPYLVTAQEYDISEDYDEFQAFRDRFVYPGDEVKFCQGGYEGLYLYYIDCDGRETVLYGVDNYYGQEETFIVKGYNDDEFTENGSIDESKFKCWQVIEIYESSGTYFGFTLRAVPYTESNITYELDGGTNSASNPDTYLEGKEVVDLATPSKEGYTFAGWYTDATFAADKKVTSIDVDQTGDITLYAKFELGSYGITYELDGGTNGAGNPDT